LKVSIADSASMNAAQLTEVIEKLANITCHTDKNYGKSRFHAMPPQT
jgi:hypothetical protein